MWGLLLIKDKKYKKMGDLLKKVLGYQNSEKQSEEKPKKIVKNPTPKYTISK